MSLITNKQQGLIDESIDHFIKVYDKVSQQYLSTRKQILLLSSEAARKKELSSQDKINVQKLQYELDSSWEAFQSHLEGLNQKLEIAKQISPRYVEELNSQHELLLSSKLSLTKTIKNIKEVQVPLLEKMKRVIQVFEKDLSKSLSTRYPSKDFITKALENPSERSMDVKALIISRTKLYELFNEFDERAKELKTVYDISESASNKPSSARPIKASSYVNQELELKEKFVPLDNDEYLFKVSKIGYQDSYLANASIPKYDKLNEQLMTDILELINHATTAKESWINNAHKMDRFRQVLEEDQDIEMKD